MSATPDPIGVLGGINLYGYVQNNPVMRVDPSGLVTSIITVQDYGVGTHSALFIDNGGSPVLYDPAGSYRAETRGSGDALYDNEANLNSYINYHTKMGSTVNIININTTAAQEAEIASRIEEIGGAMPFGCTMSVSSAIQGVGPFKKIEGIYYRPGSLDRATRKLK